MKIYNYIIQYLLLFLFLVVNIDLSATQCIIISGAKQDYLGGPLKGEKLLQVKEGTFNEASLLVAGHKCYIFNSWDLAISYLHTSTVQNEKLIIIQGAHGAKQGGALTNDGYISGSEIMKYLKKVAVYRKVAAFINSCYSGDLIKSKLLDDNIKDPQVTNLCLITSSYFGRPALGDGGLFKALVEANVNDSAEDIFNKTSFGMISGAAWETAKIPEYISTNNTVVGYLWKIFNKDIHKKDLLSKMLEISNFYTNGNKVSAFNVLASSNVGNSQMKTILKHVEHAGELLYKDDLINWNNNIINLINGTNSNSNKYDLGILNDLSQALIEITSVIGKSTWVTNAYDSLTNHIYINHNDITKYWYKDFLVPKDIRNLFDDYLQTKEKYEELLNKIETENYISDYNPSMKKDIIDSILGEFFYKIEIDDVNGLISKVPSRFSTPITALHEFIRGSLLIKDYDNDLDNTRREACKSFDFK